MSFLIILCLTIAVLTFVFVSLLYGLHISLGLLNETDIAYLKANRDKKAKAILGQISQSQFTHLHSYLSIIHLQIISAVVSVFLIYSFTSGINFYIVCFALVIGFVIFGKILPQQYAKNYSLEYAKRTIFLITFIDFILHPIYKTIHRIWFKKYSLSYKKQILPEDLAEKLETTDSTISKEKEMLEGIVKLSRTTVQSIMTPRVNIHAYELRTPFSELIANIKTNGYSRVPIYEKTLDNIKGILFVKDLLPHIHKPDKFRWQSLIRSTFYVPESKKIDILLQEFQTTKTHLAVILDEYGGISGIITLEDILEEILGEIEDEFDNDTPITYKKIDEFTYEFTGTTSLIEICKVLHLDQTFFDSVSAESETIAGFILELKNGFPKLYEIIEFKHLALKIISENDKRIEKIEITLQPEI